MNWSPGLKVIGGLDHDFVGSCANGSGRECYNIDILVFDF
jgi:hypothetical protein